MSKGHHRFRKKPRKGQINKEKLITTPYGVVQRPRVRKRKKH